MKIQSIIPLTNNGKSRAISGSSKHISFCAQQYPSNIYSNWFVAQVKGFLQQEPSRREALISNELKKYEQELNSKYKSFLQKLVGYKDRDLQTRKCDYEFLEQDLLKEQEENGCLTDAIADDNLYPKIDTPEGVYSSAVDYLRRNPTRGPSDPLDALGSVYGSDNANDPFWYP